MRGQYKIKTLLIVMMGLLAVLGTGCSKEDSSKTDKKTDVQTEKMLRIYETAYQKFAKDVPPQTEKMVQALGKDGLTAVDSHNAYDMAQYERAETFLVNAQAGRKGELQLIQVLDDGRAVDFRLKCSDKKLEVTQNAVSVDEKGEAVTKKTNSFRAEEWSYTKKGYLIFNEKLPKGYDGPADSYAFRVTPLSQKCREYQTKYLGSLAYYNNNLFLTDWQAPDYTKFNFQDLYEYFYELHNGDTMERKDEPYNVPAAEFEKTIQSYLDVTKEELRKQVTYYADSDSYLWTPRNMYEYQQPTGPVPEVTAYEEGEDDTLILTVDAVWADKKTDAGFSHMVTLKELPDGTYRYQSNKIVPSESNLIPDYIARGRDGSENMRTE